MQAISSFWKASQVFRRSFY